MRYEHILWSYHRPLINVSRPVKLDNETAMSLFSENRHPSKDTAYSEVCFYIAVMIADHTSARRMAYER